MKRNPFFIVTDRAAGAIGSGRQSDCPCEKETHTYFHRDLAGAHGAQAQKEQR